jgi:hypothetical protein
MPSRALVGRCTNPPSVCVCVEGGLCGMTGPHTLNHHHGLITRQRSTTTSQHSECAAHKAVCVSWLLGVWGLASACCLVSCCTAQGVLHSVRSQYKAVCFAWLLLVIVMRLYDRHGCCTLSPFICFPCPMLYGGAGGG